MATTTPFPFRDFPLRDLPTTDHQRAVVDDLIEEYQSALGDSDKAGETDTASYHEGRAEAFADALGMLLDVPAEAWAQYQQGQPVTPAFAHATDPEPERQDRVPAGVSPANDEPPVQDTFEHVPGEAFAEAHAYFTDARNGGANYTLMPASGWYLYDGPRLITLHWWGITGEHVQDRQVEHAELLRDVSNYMDRLAVGAGTGSHEFLMASAAFDLILSDAQTGTSLSAWPVMRRLVNQVITEMYTRDDGITVTSEWEEF